MGFAEMWRFEGGKQYGFRGENLSFEIQ